MEVPIQRPTKMESDEDLLKQQELFLKQKFKPSVQVKKQIKKDAPDIKMKENIDKAGEICLGSSSEGCVQLDIQERIQDFTKVFKFEESISAPSFDSKIKSINSSKPRTKSIFAQKQMENGKRNYMSNKSDVIDNEKGCSSSSIAERSEITARKEGIEMQGIHEENLAKISQMSKETILEYQEQLKKQLNPEMINFLKSRKQKLSEKSKDSPKQDKTIDSLKPHIIAGNQCSEENTVIRKEGREDCDAILLENALDKDFEHASVKQNTSVCDNKSKEDVDLPEETQELLEKSDGGHWLNMNKVEKNKLEWMTKLPKPKPVDLTTGHVARFDFEGKVLARDADAPTTEGLHHHSSEPEVAGYSLEELFLLSRSTVQSQRITALQTIARILENNWLGKLDYCFDKPLLSIFLQSGIVPLLRWSLDDTTASSISVAISAIHSLLICKADEICLDRTFFWLNGHVMLQLEAQDLEQPNALEELTDSDLIKLDVIKGWLRTDILARFRYLFELPLTPPPSVCQLMLEICTRIAQHSTESAEKVVNHSGLMDMIFRKYLPINWPCIDINQWNNAKNFVYPMYSAMKLVRYVASSSKELAFHLINKYNLLDSLRCYLTIQPSDSTLPLKDIQKLMVESLKTWQIFLTYGLGVEIYFDLFPVFLRQFDFCQSLDLNADVKKHFCDFQYATAFLKALEAVVVIAANQDDSHCCYSPTLSWDQVAALLQKAEICLRKWLWEFKECSLTMVSMDLLGACLNFIATFYKKSHENFTCDETHSCKSAKEIFKEYLIPALASKTFKNMLDNISSYSALLMPLHLNSVKRDDPTLISLGTVLWRDDIVPILKENSPFPLILAFLNYVNIHKSLFNDEENKVSEIVLCGPMREYLKLLLMKPLNYKNWFCQFELHMICELITLSTQSSEVKGELILWHQLAATILPCFKKWDEWLLKDLLENVIFNEKFLTYHWDTSLSSLCSENSHIIKITRTRLPLISNCYMQFLLDRENVEKSRCLLQRHVSGLDSAAFQIFSNQIIKKYWSYHPILNLYQKSKNSNISDGISEEDISKVMCSLQWTHMCNSFNLANFKNIPSFVKFYFLNIVFLLDEDLFRDDSIQSLLKVQLLQLVQQDKKINIEKNSKDIPSFEDVYLEMLIQFESVSYGDHLFGSFILFPLQQIYSGRWKKLLLSEHLQALRFLGVPLSELGVKIENYLEPFEQDQGVLMLYFKALASGILNSKRCSLIYLMAIHHLHRFIFTKSDHQSDLWQKSLISRILKLSNNEVRRHILLYSGYSQTEELRFSQRASLSPEHQKHLSDICDISVIL